MIKADFIIIGAGIAGASVAYELSKHGKVIVLERESQPGYHTTGRSAAVLETTYGQGDPAIYALTKTSSLFLENPPSGFTDAELLNWRGELYIAPKDDRDKVIERYEKLIKMTDDVKLVDREEIRKIVPIINDNYGDLGLYLENELADIDVHALHEGYMKGAKTRGTEFINKAEVLRISKLNEIWSIETNVGSYSAPIIVNAAGSWVDEIAKKANVQEIGIRPQRRTMIVVDAPDGINDIDNWPMVVELVDTFYFKTDAGKIIISPCDKTLSEPCDAQPEEIDVAYAAHYFQECTDIEIHKVEQKWAGLRNGTKDKYPALGFAPDADGFFWLAGQEGIGIMTSPAMSRIATSLIIGEEIPKDIRDVGFDLSLIDVKRFF